MSSFYGIAIRLYFGDHDPPHFHARHGECEALVRIVDGAVLAGELPARARRMVEEWRSLHVQELHDRWYAARAGESLQRIEPLP